MFDFDAMFKQHVTDGLAGFGFDDRTIRAKLAMG
jgi:hypothetical protein